MNIFFLSLASLLIVASSCARKRPVEKVLDFEGNRWAKASFESEDPWLSKVTVVKTSSTPGFAFVGLQSEVYLGKFVFSQDSLSYISAIELHSDGSNAEKVINSWPISHSEYHRRVIEGRVSNVETENDRISWKDKDFFKIDWENSSVSESASFPFQINQSCFTATSKEIVDGSQEVSSEYITFTLAVDYQLKESCISSYKQIADKDYVYTVHYKYSFMPDIEGGYKPYVFDGEADPLKKKYGYFETVLPRLGENRQRTNIFMMNRWDPEKNHTFYFAEDFPDDYKWIYNHPKNGIIVRTNKIMADHGIKMRFKIEDNDGSKKFGDIRYSFIKFVSEADSSAPLGYGPSDAHPLTGQIFAANSILWTNELNRYTEIVKEYNEQKSIPLQGSPVLRGMEALLNEKKSDWESSAAFLNNDTMEKVYRFLIPEFTYNTGGSRFTFYKNTIPDFFSVTTLKDFQKEKPGFTDLNRVASVSSEVIADKVDHLKYHRDYMKPNASIYHLDDSIVKEIGTKLKSESDPQKIINDILYRVAIHEFGHNLNLRHNFYGSLDARIERSPGEDLSGKVTSSVMDYLSLSDEVGLDYDWEVYDRAALVYAYTSGEQDLAKDFDTHLFCTDEHRAFNALCNAYDHGSTPTEVLLSLIESYEQSYWIRNFRNDRAYWNVRNYDSQAFNTMFQIKKMVKMYQETFLPSQVGAYLSEVASTDVASLATLAIRNDITKAVQLAAAFYSSVIKVNQLERPFGDQYDEFTGRVTRLGIFPDKLFAKLFLMGDDAFPLNPNFGSLPVSFVSLRDDPVIGSFIDRVLLDTFANSGDGYAGFDSLGRQLYALNARRYFDYGGGQGAIDLMKLLCYTEESFKKHFDIDPEDPVGDGNPITVGVFPGTNTDGEFVNEGSFAIIRLNGKLYVAGVNRNPYAAEVIKKVNVLAILESHLFYHQAIGEERSCK